MRYLLLVLLAACGPMPMPDAGEDAGSDAGADAGAVHMTLTWQTATCMACQASADVAAHDVAGVRASLNSSLNGWMCTTSDMAIDCTYRCANPPGTDGGCGWTPCLGGPLVCR